MTHEHGDHCRGGIGFRSMFTIAPTRNWGVAG
jgi:phosphoribosyl 1,2-cyclic phosphodiesterase